MLPSWLIPVVALALTAATSQAAEPLPPKPTEYVTDRAGILSAKTVTEWNTRLATYERETSNQVLAAIFPTVPEGYAMEDFTNRTFDAWGVGQKKNNNGAVLFIFPNDRKMRIEVGYGLEGAIPDAIAKRILDNEVRPAFRSGDFDAGVSRGLEAILAAARGEYRGANAENVIEIPFSAACFLAGIAGLVIFGYITQARQRGKVYRRRGAKRGIHNGWSWGRSADWSSGGGWSSGSSSGGGGGFSGGGGSSGGGGASGSW